MSKQLFYCGPETGNNEQPVARRVTTSNVATRRTTGSKGTATNQNNSGDTSQSSNHAQTTSVDSSVLEMHRLDSNPMKSCPHNEGSSQSRAPYQESMQGNNRRLDMLTAQVQQLGIEQRQHQERAEALRRSITDGEVACGRMTQEILRIQEALKLRTQHVKEDREAAARELRLRDSKMEEILRMIEQMRAPMQTTDTESGRV